MLVMLMCDSRHGAWVLGTARSLCYDALHSRDQAVVEGPHFAAGHVQRASLIPSQGGRSLSGPNESLALFSQERKGKRMTHDQHPPFPHHICPQLWQGGHEYSLGSFVCL